MKKYFVYVLALAVLLIGPSVSSQDDNLWPTETWAISTPEAQGMSSEELAAFFSTWSQTQFNLDGMVVVRNGHIVAEAYGPLMQPNDLHEMASVSKSITSMLIGIMLQEGLLESLDTPALSLLPDRTIASMDANKEAITIRDLLKMASGLESNDMDVPPGVAGTSAIMETTDDWLQYALDLPSAYEPGTRWYYCNAAVHILSGIITEMTGMSALDYAAAKLFAPLGITAYEWSASPTGITLGYSDLKLSTRDMAKLGYLYLNDGQWDGQQIIPADFVQESLASQIMTPWPATGYSYLWWRVEPINLTFALGFGGQYIMVFPDKNMVVAVTSAMTDNIRVGLQAYPMFFAAAGLSAADESLPDNPAAFEALQTLVADIHEPAAQAVPPLPALAQTISGQMYGLSATNLYMSHDGIERFARYKGIADSLGINWFRLTFDDSAQATLTFGFTDNETWDIPIGLDGLYRISEGRPGVVGAKGEWLGDSTFRVYVRYKDFLHIHRFDFNFIPGGLDIISYDYVAGQGIAVQGVAMQQ